MVMDDDFYDAWNFYPDSRDSTRRGLGLRIEVRGFQWANPQARNVIFWHYDITNEGTTDYDDNIIFGLYMDSGVGGSALSCDGIFESDDDNAFFNREFDEEVINLVYTWDNGGPWPQPEQFLRPDRVPGLRLHGDARQFHRRHRQRRGRHHRRIARRRPGHSHHRAGPDPGLRDGQLRPRALRDHLRSGDRKARLSRRASGGPATRIWTGPPTARTWVRTACPTPATTGEGDGIPTAGEPNFDDTDLNESDQIGLTGLQDQPHRPGPGQSQPGDRRHRLLHRQRGLARAAVRPVHRPRSRRPVRRSAGLQLQHRLPVRVGAVHA